MLIAAIAIIVFLLIFRLVKWMAYHKYEWYAKYMTINGMIFYNLFLRYALQSTLKIQIGAGVTLVLLNSWSEGKEIIQGVIAILMIVAMTICPFSFGLILYRNFENLDVLSMRNKFGTIYASCFLDSLDTYPLTYSIIYMLRRSLFVFLTFALYSQPGIQI